VIDADGHASGVAMQAFSLLGREPS